MIVGIESGEVDEPLPQLRSRGFGEGLEQPFIIELLEHTVATQDKPVAGLHIGGVGDVEVGATLLTRHQGTGDDILASR